MGGWQGRGPPSSTSSNTTRKVTSPQVGPTPPEGGIGVAREGAPQQHIQLQYQKNQQPPSRTYPARGGDRGGRGGGPPAAHPATPPDRQTTDGQTDRRTDRQTD